MNVEATQAVVAVVPVVAVADGAKVVIIAL